MYTTRTSLLAVGIALLMIAGSAQAAPGDTELISAIAGAPKTAAGAEDPTISADGRFVVFKSNQGGLVPGVDDGLINVFVRDRQTGVNEVVSVNSNGDLAGSGSGDTPSSISADGRYVAFTSAADNLAPGDDNGEDDVYVRDRQSGITERVSVNSKGDGGNSGSFFASISADGRYVAFESFATNLVPGDVNGQADIFVFDRQTRVTELVSVDSNYAQGNLGSSGPAISANGRYVAFTSRASNLVLGDNNGVADIFVHDRQTGITERVSVDSHGMQANGESGRISGEAQGPVISADGRFVAFHSEASNLVPGDSNGTRDIFVRDRQSGVTELVSVGASGTPGNGESDRPSISADGRFVAFTSRASNLVPGVYLLDWGSFARDRQTKTTEFVAQQGSRYPSVVAASSISADGSLVAFDSTLQLVSKDTNDRIDVYVDELGGTGPGTLAFTLKPSALAFGMQPLFERTARLSFWLRNTGTAVLPIMSIRLYGLDKSQFRFASFCGTSLRVGASCKISVTFRPTSLGPKSAELWVVAGPNALRKRGLTGTGV